MKQCRGVNTSRKINATKLSFAIGVTQRIDL